MRILRPSQLVLPCILLACSLLAANEPSSQEPDAAKPHDRREAIQTELDQNQEAVKDLYSMLDATLEDEKDCRSFLESMIQRYDDRSNVLFEELDAIDKAEFKQQRKQSLILQIERLEKEAKQLEATNHPDPAMHRRTKAKSLRKALADGAWEILVDSEWSKAGDSDDIFAKVQLVVELERLKAETTELRKEVIRLQSVVDGSSSATKIDPSPVPLTLELNAPE